MPLHSYRLRVLPAAFEERSKKGIGKMSRSKARWWKLSAAGTYCSKRPSSRRTQVLQVVLAYSTSTEGAEQAGVSLVKRAGEHFEVIFKMQSSKFRHLLLQPNTSATKYGVISKEAQVILNHKKQNGRILVKRHRRLAVSLYCTART